jgi:dihydrofolate synthase/folylpolyglutamate synthase
MEYAEARRVLGSLPSLEVKPGLDRIERLLSALGHPERAFPAIHIAGTNGKGSVAAMLASILGAAGHRVGRYTSPDLEDFRDRIAVDGQWIGEDDLARGVDSLLPLLSSGRDQPTQFEALTAVAFDHFAARHVDLAVVEVGLGGRFDATNVVRPLLSLLTNVGRDHLHLLGPTLADVAWEKVGIAKPGVPLLVGDLVPEAERVVAAVCAGLGAEPLRSDSVTVGRVARDWEKAVYDVRGEGLPDRVVIPLLGGYQAANLRLALSALQVLRRRGLRLLDEAILSGLASVRWPGRFEVVAREPAIVLDGAHNLPGALALADEVRDWFPDREVRHLLFGALADKEVGPMMDALFPLFPRVTLTRSRSPRALPVGDLLAACPRVDPPPASSGSVEEGLALARWALRSQDALVVTGSLTVVAEARAVLVGGGR